MNRAAMLSVKRELSLVQSLVDNTSSVIYVKNVDFRYLLVNQQFETLFHLCRDEILGKTDFDIFPPEVAEEFRKNDLEVFESEEAIQCHENALHDDGLHTYFSQKFPLRDADGLVYAIAGISTDITEQIRQQHEFNSLLHRQIAIEQEIQTARRIQISLMPKSVPEIPGFEFAATSVPCSRACGDYYDFIEWGRGQLGIAVGDVSGHGLGAALEMIATRSVLRTTMMRETDPVQCLKQLNEILSADLPDEMFVTLFLARVDTKARTLTYAAAGHDAFLLRDGDDDSAYPSVTSKKTSPGRSG